MSLDPTAIEEGLTRGRLPKDVRYYAVSYGHVATSADPLRDWIGFDEAQWRGFMYCPGWLLTNIIHGIEEAQAWLAGGDKVGMNFKRENFIEHFSRSGAFVGRVRRATLDRSHVAPQALSTEPDSAEELTGEESESDSTSA